jgi:hypothetical protein
MTREEFNQKRFHAGTIIHHAPSNKTFFVVSVDFEEQLIGVDENDFYENVPDDEEEVSIKWLRCENCEILNEDDYDQTRTD